MSAQRPWVCSMDDERAHLNRGNGDEVPGNEKLGRGLHAAEVQVVCCSQDGLSRLHVEAELLAVQRLNDLVQLSLGDWGCHRQPGNVQGAEIELPEQSSEVGAVGCQVCRACMGGCGPCSA